MPDRVFVAPHPDDVALSCGGTVSVIARSSSPVIVTVFGGEPREGLSEFARFQHERWGMDHDGVVKQRRSEDDCAARALGSRVRTHWLDYLDAIYRDPAYSSDEALFGRLVQSDLELVDAIVDDLAVIDAEEYVVPLAVGNHVDHQLVFRAGRRLAKRGRDVWAYADVPYAIDPKFYGLTERLARGTVREARVVYLDDEAFASRWQAISCYESQLPVIFRNLGDPQEAVEWYARSVGGGELAEVFWRVLPP